MDNKQGCQTLCKAIEYFLQIATLGPIEEKEVIVKIGNTYRKKRRHHRFCRMLIVLENVPHHNFNKEPNYLNNDAHAANLLFCPLLVVIF